MKCGMKRANKYNPMKKPLGRKELVIRLIAAKRITEPVVIKDMASLSVLNAMRPCKRCQMSWNKTNESGGAKLKGKPNAQVKIRLPTPTNPTDSINAGANAWPTQFLPIEL